MYEPHHTQIISPDSARAKLGVSWWSVEDKHLLHLQHANRKSKTRRAYEAEIHTRLSTRPLTIPMNGPYSFALHMRCCYLCGSATTHMKLTWLRFKLRITFECCNCQATERIWYRLLDMRHWARWTSVPNPIKLCFLLKELSKYNSSTDWARLTHTELLWATTPPFISLQKTLLDASQRSMFT